MASISVSTTRGAFIDNLSAGSQAVTEGTSAPGAGDIELRIDLTKNLTKREIKNALGVFYRFIQNPNTSTTVPI